MNKSNVEECTEPETYDYFSSSEISFILTFVGTGLLILGKKWITRNINKKFVYVNEIQRLYNF